MRIELFFSVGKQICWLSNFDTFAVGRGFLEIGDPFFRRLAFKKKLILSHDSL